MSGVIVLSGPRTGSSAVGGLLDKLVFMGKSFQVADASNPTGYFEDLRFQYWNKELIGTHYGSGKIVTKISGDMLKKLHGFVRWNETHHKFWGVKDPRFAWTFAAALPTILKASPKLGVIFHTRAIEDAAKSLAKHSEIAYNGTKRMSYVQALDMQLAWDNALGSAIDTAIGADLHAYATDYDTLVAETPEIVHELVQFIRQIYPQFEPSDSSIAAAIRFIEDRHGKRN